MSIESSPFKVAMRDLPAHRRIQISSQFVDDLVRGMPMRDALEAVPPDDGGAAELDLDTDGKTVFVTGRITGQVTVACSRCVGPAPIRFDDEVHVTFLPAHELPSDDEDEAAEGAKGKAAEGKSKPAAEGKGKAAEGKGGKGKGKDEEDLGVELAEDDLDVFPYTGDVVDLEPLVREQFVLAVPYAPLCKEDCLGLCPQCGADRNVSPCHCEKPIDPRFVALQGLKLPPS